MAKRHFLAIPFAALLAVSATGLGRASESKKLARGRYLINEVGKCQDCHTPRLENGKLDEKRWLQGTPLDFEPKNEVPDWANTAPGIAGLPGWSDEDAVKLLTTGLGRNGKPLRPPMPEYRLKPEDAKAMVEYLGSLK